MASTATTIEWTEATWNPTVGCDRISPGCAKCYAKELHDRRHKAFLAGKDMAPQYAKPFEALQLMDDRLDAPLHWRRPKRIFVNSVSDLFHEDVPDAFIDRVFAVMALAPQHTFQILTKRAERMRDYLQMCLAIDGENGKPLPNVWLGVSVENQHFADERIPLLLHTPSAVRFLSLEPLLEQVDLTNYLWTIPGARLNGLHWLIVGGESGSGARPFDVAWARWTIAQGRSAGVPVFVKQLGAKPFGSCTPEGCSIAPHSMQFKHSKSGNPDEWPEDLRVRQFPEAHA